MRTGLGYLGHIFSSLDRSLEKNLSHAIHCEHNKYNLLTTDCGPYDTTGYWEKERQSL